MFSYILVVSRSHILLIFICPMFKAGKLHSIASCAILAISFKNYFKGAKIWWPFSERYKNSTDCFVMEVSTVNAVSTYLLKKWEQYSLLSMTQNPKRDKAIIRIKHKDVQRNESSSSSYQV